MKRNKGFTLMELLAVLVILAIIALIVFPIIGDVITDSKMKAFKSSVYGLEHAVDLDYQKDYYTGVREYSYENGNLVLNSVKGESKNKNIKVEGIIENGVGTISVDKNGNTSLMIYNDEYCAVKDYEDKTISTGKASDDICKTKIPTPTICFDYGKIPTSYDINLENCKTYFASLISEYSDSDVELFCTKGQTASDGASLEKQLNDLYNITAEDLEEQQVIENVVYSNEIRIINYNGYKEDPNTGNVISQPINEKCNYDVKIPDQIKGMTVTNIGGGAFAFAKIESITIPESVKKIGQGAFAGNNLKSISIPSGITAIQNSAFADNQLTTVTIPNNVETIENFAFFGNKLTSVTLGNNVTTIGDHAFFDNNLTNVTFPNSVTNIGTWAFYENNIETISFGNNVQTIGDKAFAYNNLSEIILPTSLMSIGYSAFYKNSESNSNLTYIYNAPKLDIDWHNITGGNANETFYRGIVSHDNGDIEIGYPIEPQ